MISCLSFSKEIFDKTAHLYSNFLNAGSFKEEITHSLSMEPLTKRNKSQKAVWFTPPYSPPIATNVGKIILALIEKHFPIQRKYMKLVFNRHNLKISFSSILILKI